MRTKTLTANVATALIAATTNSSLAAPTYPVDVPFLQAAIFFMFGKEGADVTYESEKKAVVKSPVRFRGPGGNFEIGRWEVTLKDDRPCVLFAALLSPEAAFNTVDPSTGEGNGGRRLEFNNLPSPRSFTYNYRSGYASFDIPHETWCSYRTVFEDGELKLLSGSSTCNTGISFKLTPEWWRKIAALDYIRANYCKGQPEPAPQPRLPY